MKLTTDRLIAACADDSFDSGIRISTTLEPLGGPDAPVQPAVYEGGRYQLDERWRGVGDDRRRVVAVIIDNVPSQANRLEAALVGVPLAVEDRNNVTGLQPQHPADVRCVRTAEDSGLPDGKLLGGEKSSQNNLGSAIISNAASVFIF